MDRIDDEVRLAALTACRVLDGPQRPHLDRIAELVVSITGAPICLVSMVDDRRQFFAAQVGLGGQASEDRGTPLSHSMCRYVVLSDEPLVVSDAPHDPVFAEHPAVTELGVVAYCGVPIRDGGGQVLGSLCAIDTAVHEWSAHDVAVLQGMAEAVSVELATDVRYRQLTVDLHRRLLPLDLPTSHRWELGVAYRPLETDAGLGGDFYDAIEGPDGSLTLVIGDIVGHDAASAIAMGQLRAGTLALVHHGASLLEIVDTLDRSCRSLPDVFCSAWVAVRVDASGRRATYLGAGAVQPLLVRADGSASYLDDARTTPIGVAGRRREGTAEVGPGDVLVLCSDGLVESRRIDLDQGLARVASDVAAVHELAAGKVAQAALDGRAGVGPFDDDTVVLVCRLS